MRLSFSRMWNAFNQNIQRSAFAFSCITMTNERQITFSRRLTFFSFFFSIFNLKRSVSQTVSENIPFCLFSRWLFTALVYRNICLSANATVCTSIVPGICSQIPNLWSFYWQMNINASTKAMNIFDLTIFICEAFNWHERMLLLPHIRLNNPIQSTLIDIRFSENRKIVLFSLGRLICNRIGIIFDFSTQNAATSIFHNDLCADSIHLSFVVGRTEYSLRVSFTSLVAMIRTKRKTNENIRIDRWERTKNRSRVGVAQMISIVFIIW